MTVTDRTFYVSKFRCPYIQEKFEQLFYITETVSASPSPKQSGIDFKNLMTHYAEEGLRRQGRSVYFPICPSCSECVATRVLVEEFVPNRRFNRVLRMNDDIELVISRTQRVTDHEAFQLYTKYIESRHSDGVMHPPDFSTMQQIFKLEQDRDDFHIYGYLNGDLVLLGITDVVADGLSANYTMFDPTMPRRSLGTLGILKQIELCKAQGLAYLYLGYAIESVRKMKYKVDFQPQERRIGSRWVRSDD